MVFLDAICPATIKVEDARLFYQVNKDDFEGQSSGKKRKLNGICDSDCGVHLDKKFSVPPRMIEGFDWLAEEVKSECGWEAPKKSRDSKGKVLHNGDMNASNESSLPPPSHYLLSPSQMTELGYPDENELMSACGYMRIPSVSKVDLTSDSPLLAIDCEMCLVRNRYTLQSESALTRVAVVDEKYNTLYDTLVKPKGRVYDYLTRFSGITEDMLLNVKTTLDQVQREVMRVIPPNAILVGHSLNFDLHALKMVYPHVIDTSQVLKKPSWSPVRLKHYIKALLEQSIQKNERGHDPVEDAVAAMRLAQVKIANGPQFYFRTAHGVTMEAVTSRCVFGLSPPTQPGVFEGVIMDKPCKKKQLYYKIDGALFHPIYRGV
ncbi:uncharacterized protein LOC134853070 isoform X3 [Symsagittifera roscoffensis]|uniref:uncharacterized protein LOC134853070 isoform X3 n=1 Tax=Symsagittifera roscoffensis TaxID=84072 RepID=UPI00307BBFCD